MVVTNVELVAELVVGFAPVNVVPVDVLGGFVLRYVAFAAGVADAVLTDADGAGELVVTGLSEWLLVPVDVFTS